MALKKPRRIRNVVYVIGAGFSAGLGYPLTKGLLIEAWDRLPTPSREQISKIIRFHHPGFTSKKATSFPDIEQLLTEMAVNLQMFDASRAAEGGFTKDDLQESWNVLLSTIAAWFHEIYPVANTKPWLAKIVTRLRLENAAVVSFNWDLVLDQLLLKDAIGPDAYGLSPSVSKGPLLLKPHGSLNWSQGAQLEHVSRSKRIEIFHDADKALCVHAFLRPRAIKSKSGRRYTPLIIPPTYIKDFTPSVFQRLWKHCTDVLSTAKKIIFLGYSLPPADMHAQFILRCGFHNQLDGRLRKDGGRYPATKAADVLIVNPDQDAARRTESIAGPKVKCSWVPKQIQDWLT